MRQSYLVRISSSKVAASTEDQVSVFAAQGLTLRSATHESVTE